MSTTTYVYFGWYAVCSKMMIDIVEDVHVCERNADHNVNWKDKYCSECGGMVVNNATPTPHYFSLIDFQAFDYDDIRRAGIKITDKEINWLLKTFNQPAMLSEELTSDEQEIILLNGHSEEVYGDQIVTFNPDKIIKKPNPKQLDRLKSLMRYRNIELKFGMVVELG